MPTGTQLTYTPILHTYDCKLCKFCHSPWVLAGCKYVISSCKLCSLHSEAQSGRLGVSNWQLYIVDPGVQDKGKSGIKIVTLVKQIN